jgi:ACS family glucarate transporter-like MFS transporter
LWSVFTCLTPLCHTFGAWVLVRGLFGIAEAPAANGANIAISNWFPKHERGRAVGIFLLGSKIGPALGIPAATMLMIHYGWRAAFWGFGVFGLLCAFLYFVLLRTHPHESRFVNKAELEHICAGQAIGASMQEKALAPWGQFLRSRQFWCIGIQWGMASVVVWVFLVWLPVYLIEAHHFSLKGMGFAAMVPEAAYGLGVIICGLASDYVISHEIASSKARAWFGGGGQLISCLCLYMTATSESKLATIVWLSIALFFTGFSFNSGWTSASDLGGRFSGSVAGWMQTLNLISAPAPVIVGWVATHWGWKAGVLVPAMSGIIGATCWVFVHPERPLKGTEQAMSA